MSMRIVHDKAII